MRTGLKRLTISLFAASSALRGGPITAPTRLLLWAPGPVRGDFPANVWDAEAARSVMAAYLERANGDPSKAFIPLDIEHATNPQANPLYDPAKPPPGGGYAGLQLDSRGALWLDPIEWSAYARNEIESGSRRAISPDWDYEPKTGRPVRLKKVSLVQNPGTYGIGLVASAGANGDKTMDYAMFIAALEAALQAEDPKGAVEALLAKVKAMQGEGGETTLDAAAAPGVEADPKETMMAAAKAMLASLPKAKGATASAPIDVADIRRQAREEGRAAGVQAYREEHQKTALIAGAAQSPGMTPALATQLAGLPLATVKGIVGALPAPVPSADQAAATAAAAAKAGQQAQPGVKAVPIPGAQAASATASATETEPTAQEVESLRLINESGMSTEERRKKFDTEKALLASAGIGAFSGVSLIEAAQKRVLGLAN